LSPAKRHCIASPVVVQTEFGFERSKALDSAVGSENAPMPNKLAAYQEVTDSNPPVVSLPDVDRANGNTACTEFSKRWTCK
jgi:hypothetical protein